ncbi:phosphatase PAP2 family protein [Halonotius sp. F2-221B]|uniref:phosphatase PAP2 family protein n=1 Tax=Halonotius sp. F2-221B TaxID=2731620 RepID=UPI00398AAE42
MPPLPLVAATESVVTLFAVITLLGDAWLLFVGLSVGYWIGPRVDDDSRAVAATVIALATLALAVVLAVKSYTAIPRPAATPIDPAGLPGGLAGFVAGELDSSGFAFPSGHATGVTAVYGGLAALLTIGRRQRRYAAAATMIGLVSGSRVILGVHYPRDIVAGIALGVGLIVLARWVAADESILRADRVCLLAGVASVVGLGVAAVGGHTEEVRHAVIGLGTAVGAGATWYRGGERLTAAPAVSIPVAAGGLVVAGGLWIGAYEGVFGLVGAAVGSAVGVIIILGLPLVEQWRKKEGNAAVA